MIRTLWVGINVGAATLFLGTIAIGASLLRVRGDLYSRLTRTWSRWILWASDTPLIVHGLDNVRPDEPQVVVSNHVSGYDIFAVAAALPGTFSFVAKKELERIPFFGTAWKAAGHISIDRSNRQQALLSLQKAGEKIRREKGTVIIYPEGTRSKTGELLPFKKGAFMLAVEAQVPIVPTVVRGTRRIVHDERWTIHPQPIHIHFGTPVSTHGFRAGSAERLMETVRAQMLAMLNEPQALSSHAPLQSRG